MNIGTQCQGAERESHDCQELLLDAEPCAGLCAASFTNVVLEVDGDHAEQPGKHNTNHLMPRLDVEVRDIREDMIIKSIALKGEQHKATPPIVLGGYRVEDYRH